MVEDPKFNNTILTNIGHQMLASISSGNKKITYTKAEAYTQDVSSISNETLQALTSLQGKELSANLLVSNDNGNVVTITANFRNKGLTNDMVFNSIGWFAKLDTDDAERGITANQEYLIGITPANGAQTLVAPPADQSSSQAISLNLNMTLSDASNVSMTVSDAGAVHFNQLDDQLAKYTTTSDLTKLLAGKADLGLSYTKAELDAKLLNLTTDTNGKVSADQVQALISDKANISDVYTKSQIDSALSTRDAQISTKANISDVYTKSQIDSDFSARDTQINTKANISDVYTKSDVDSALAADRGRLGKLEGTQTLDSPDFNSITASGVYYITNNTPANIKNNPASQLGVLVVSNGDGHRASQVYYPDDGSAPWCRSLNESNWLPWYQLSTKKDVSNATNAASSKVDTALGNSYFRKQGMNENGDLVEIRENAVKQANGGYAFDIWSSDWTASKVKEIINQVASLNSAWQVRTYPNAVNLNDLWTAWGISYLTNIGNTNTPSFIDDKRGTLFTFTFDDNGKWQIFAGCIGGLAYRSYLKDDGAWHKIADDTDISDLQSKITNAQNTANSANTNANGRLSLGGGNMTLRSTINWNGGGIDDRTGNLGGLNWAGGTDWAQIYGDQDGNDNLDLAIDLGDDGSNHVSFRKNGSETSAITSDGHFTGTVDWSRVNGRPEVTPVINGSTGDDLFAYKTNQLRLYPGNGLNCKNLPPANNTQWFTVQYVFETPNNDGIAIFRSPGTEVWINGNNGGTYGTWKRLADSGDITDLRNQIQQLRENQFETQTFTDATAAANWEAQRPGHRLAIIQS